MFALSIEKKEPYDKNQNLFIYRFFVNRFYCHMAAVRRVLGVGVLGCRLCLAGLVNKTQRGQKAMSKLIFVAILDESGEVIGRARGTDCQRVIDIAMDCNGRGLRSYRVSREISKINLAAASQQVAHKNYCGAFWVWG
jgi:hypothetical protein